MEDLGTAPAVRFIIPPCAPKRRRRSQVSEFPQVERVARAIARGQMSRNMKDAPPVTQELYLDAVWKDYEQAALNAMTELGVMP